jgi:hypothetical protein
MKKFKYVIAVVVLAFSLNSYAYVMAVIDAAVVGYYRRD